MQDGKEIIILLVGGEKGSQDKDIVKARELARSYKETRSDEN